MFFINALLLGVGLAMDAFSVSMANGLIEPQMKRGKAFAVAGVFGGFQTVMPLIGWLCVHTLFEAFSVFRKFVPWIALVLLGIIGGKMIYEGVKGENAKAAVGVGGLLLQGVATSIDALSVGLTIAEYDWLSALVEALIIGAVTFGICFGGVHIGRKLGTKLSGKASILGGAILLIIGMEIFLKGIL